MDGQIDRIFDDSADFVIESKSFGVTKNVKYSKDNFSELFRSFKQDHRSYPQTIEKPPESY